MAQQEKIEKQVNVRGTIRRMNAGAERSFPIEKLAYVREIASKISVSEKKEFTTYQNKTKTKIIIQRTK